jgi:hypothetical protein
LTTVLRALSWCACLRRDDAIVIAAVTIGLSLVITAAVAVHLRRYKAKLAVLRSLAGQRVTLGYSTGGNYPVRTAIDARIDAVPASFPATCYLTPYAVEAPNHTWRQASGETRIALDDSVLIDRIVWLETEDGSRYDF